MNRFTHQQSSVIGNQYSFFKYGIQTSVYCLQQSEIAYA